MFSGCEDAQTSADVHDVAKFGLPDATGAGGACTNAVLANVVSTRIASGARSEEQRYVTARERSTYELVAERCGMGNLL